MNIIKKKKNNNKYIILFFLSIIVMFILLILIFNFINPKSNKGVIKINNGGNEPQEAEQQAEITNEEEIKNMSETQRIKRYMGIFFENIENGNYSDAYNVLNEDFKKTYFPRLEEFEKYAEKNFNSSKAIEYEDIERFANNKTGNMYIVWTIVEDILSLKQSDDEKELADRTKFVVIEYDYNNYEMSFSVISEE